MDKVGLVDLTFLGEGVELSESADEIGGDDVGGGVGVAERDRLMLGIASKGRCCWGYGGKSLRCSENENGGRCLVQIAWNG